MKHLIFLPFLLVVLFISCDSNSSEDIVISENPTIEDTKEKEKENETPKEKEELCTIVNNDGLLIIEAESFDLKGKWRVKEDEKASGGKYIEYYGPNSYNSQNLDNEISVKFTVDKGAKYLVKWFMRQPDEAEGDKSNDVWIYFPENLGHAWVNNASLSLEHYEKFVSRGKGEFTYGGALDLHNPKSSSWLTVIFPEAGEYTLRICARSEFFQLDKMVLSTGISNDVANARSKSLTESVKCE